MKFLNIESYKKQSIYNFLIILYLFGFTFFLSLLSNQCSFFKILPNTDSCVFLTIAKGMTQGKIPYLDFFDHKGPLLYLLNFLGFSAFGLTGVWIVEILSLFISILFSFLCVKKLHNNLTALISTTIIFLALIKYYSGGNIVEVYALPLISIALFLFVSILKSDKFETWKIIFAGFTFGLSIMLRPNMFSVWFIFSAYIVLSAIFRKEFLKAIKYAIFFFLGTIIAIIPFIIFLVANGAFQEYIYQNFLFNSTYATENLKIIQLIKKCIRALLSFNYFTFIGIIACFIEIILQKKNHQKIHIYFLLISSIALSILFISISWTIFAHYYLVLAPLVIVSISFIVKRAIGITKEKIFNNKSKNLKVIFCVLLVTIFIFSSAFIGRKYYSSIATKLIPNTEINSIIDIIDKNSQKNDTLIVPVNECQFYLFSDLTPANKFIYSVPIADISEEVNEEYKKEWINSNPTFVIRPKKYYRDLTDNINWIISQLNSNYTQIYETENYYVYRRNK